MFVWRVLKLAGLERVASWTLDQFLAWWGEPSERLSSGTSLIFCLSAREPVSKRVFFCHVTPDTATWTRSVFLYPVPPSGAHPDPRMACCELATHAPPSVPKHRPPIGHHNESSSVTSRHSCSIYFVTNRVLRRSMVSCNCHGFSYATHSPHRAAGRNASSTIIFVK
jgi:hypothetical protein